MEISRQYPLQSPYRKDEGLPNLMRSDIHTWKVEWFQDEMDPTIKKPCYTAETSGTDAKTNQIWINVVGACSCGFGIDISGRLCTHRAAPYTTTAIRSACSYFSKTNAKRL